MGVPGVLQIVKGNKPPPAHRSSQCCAAATSAPLPALLRPLCCRCAFVRDDVSTFLRAALEAGQSWDVVILDPPKLAPNR